MLAREDILNALKDVVDPEIGINIVDLGMVKDVKIDDGKVTIDVNLTVAGCPLHSTIKQDIVDAVRGIDGVKEVEVNFGVMSQEEREELTRKLHPQKEFQFQSARVIAVGSGKGGVGKSTVTVNLAIALAKQGYKVGLIDADIVGFSVSRMMGISGKRPMVIGEDTILPLEVHGIKVISMGSFADEDMPIIWRGPLLAGALEQFLNDVMWGDLDFLLLDLPPGTGDIPLTVMQKIPQAELILVTTPQAAASHVAGRLAFMAQKTQIKLLGIIENMAYFECPNCGEKHYIFGKGATEELAEELKTRILGSIPLDVKVRERSDEGRPIALDDEPVAYIYQDIAKRIAELK